MSNQTSSGQGVLTTEIALVQSKVFWASLLAFLAVIAQQFHWSIFYAWAADPATPTAILNGLALLSTLLAGVFRSTTSRKVVSIFTPPGGDTHLPALTFPLVFSVIVAAAPSGCNNQSVQIALAQIQGDIKTAEQIAGEAAPQICADIQALEQTGEVVLTSGLVGGTDVSHARTVEASIDTLCLNPTAQNSAAIVARGIGAYTQLAALFKKAGK